MHNTYYEINAEAHEKLKVCPICGETFVHSIYIKPPSYCVRCTCVYGKLRRDNIPSPAGYMRKALKAGYALTLYDIKEYIRLEAFGGTERTPRKRDLIRKDIFSPIETPILDSIKENRDVELKFRLDSITMFSEMLNREVEAVRKILKLKQLPLS